MPIQFPDAATKQTYWDTHKPDGAPDRPDDTYLPYLESLNPNETWAALCARVDLMQSHTLRGATLTMAVYGADKFDIGGGDPAAMDELLQRAAPAWSPTITPDPEPFHAWIKCSPVFHIAPTNNDNEFVWARVRCFLAGAGYSAHDLLSRALGSLYPDAPMQPTETPDEWSAFLREAHTMCGWPVHLAHVTFSKLHRVMGVISRDEFPARFLGQLALLHVLKHARYSPSQGVVVHYFGQSTAVKPEESNHIGSWVAGKRSLRSAFQCVTTTSNKAVPAVTAAVTRVIDGLDINSLIQKKPLAKLPASLLVGPWSSCYPDPTNFDGFYQTGQRMTGAWEAKDGYVTHYIGSPSEVVQYDWNVLTPAMASQSLRTFTASVPTKYAPTWASDIFHEAFPNWESSWYPDSDLWAAAKTLFDLPIAASLLRGEHPGLEQEYPAVVFMPQNPAPHASTNQGKSLATLTYARAVNPGITKLLSIADSGSAPDIRAVAAEIRASGSIAVDEFTPPRNSTHILSHDNFQALCTGSSIASGRVYENDGRVGLTSSMVFSAKVFDVPNDIQNRSLVHWLGDLTDAMRADSTHLTAIRSGALSTRMRLGLWAVLERSGLPQSFGQASPASATRGLRFDNHRTLGAMLLQHRIGCTEDRAYELLDMAVKIMADHMRSHVMDAIDSGLVASMEFGTALKLRFHSIFEELDSVQLETYCGYLRCYSSARAETRNTPGDFIRAWMELRGTGHRPLQDILPIFTGSRRHASDRAIRCALAADMRTLVSGSGSRWMLPGDLGLKGWGVVYHGHDLYTIGNTHPTYVGASRAVSLSGLRDTLPPQPNQGTPS